MKKTMMTLTVIAEVYFKAKEDEDSVKISPYHLNHYHLQIGPIVCQQYT